MPLLVLFYLLHSVYERATWVNYLLYLTLIKLPTAAAITALPMVITTTALKP